MKSMIGAASIAAAALGAGTSNACTLITPPPAPGESLGQAIARSRAQDQARNWGIADAVYLGRVVKVSRSGEVSEATFAPIAELKGRAPSTARVRVSAPWLCGPDPKWKVGDQVVIFASRIGWRDNIWKAGQWFVLGAVRPTEISDPTIAAAVARARPPPPHKWGGQD